MIKTATFEVTTRCNFKCYYCVGRSFEQESMSYNSFLELLTHHIDLYGKPDIVNLQGQGEPTINKDLFKMAAYVKSLNIKVATVTNGTYNNVSDFSIFDTVGVSLDTLDETKADSIGRFNLPKVLSFIDAVRLIVPTTIYTVRDTSGEYLKIAEYCKRKSLLHFVQALEVKPDYVKLYKGSHSINIVNKQRTPRKCPILETHRHYLVSGLMLPCTFIADTSTFKSVEDVRETLASGVVPETCTNCRFIK